MAVNKELMKGSTSTLVLTLLARKQMYGYEIIKELEVLSHGLFEMREGTLYPILHALENAGYLESKWVGDKGDRQRRYYLITKKGKAFLKEKTQEWVSFRSAVDSIVFG